MKPHAKKKLKRVEQGLTAAREGHATRCPTLLRNITKYINAFAVGLDKRFQMIFWPPRSASTLPRTGRPKLMLTRGLFDLRNGPFPVESRRHQSRLCSSIGVACLSHKRSSSSRSSIATYTFRAGEGDRMVSISHQFHISSVNLAR